MEKDLRKKIVDKLTGEDKLKESLKEQIMWYELNNTGLRMINGGDVIVKNLRIKKREKIVMANITLVEEDMGDGHYKEERIQDCDYPFKLFKELK